MGMGVVIMLKMIKNRKRRSVLERLLSKISVPISGGCWLWEGYIHPTGYGKMFDGNGARASHIVSYELSRGKVPVGLQLDHLCRVRHCVNPEHLEAVTSVENSMRGDSWKHNVVKTKCKHGHNYSGYNLIIRKDRRGRECRTCKNIRNANYKNKNKEVGVGTSV